jgi:hypothetical protein
VVHIGIDPARMSATDYTRRATLHRPTDPSVIGAEIRRMHAGGLTARDIAEALHLNLAAVIEALHSKPPEAAP